MRSINALMNSIQRRIRARAAGQQEIACVGWGMEGWGMVTRDIITAVNFRFQLWGVVQFQFGVCACVVRPSVRPGHTLTVK